MNYNYHTHTKRCSHASGEVEDYIKRAIDGGVKHMGFSDHIPLVFEDGKESFYRVPSGDAKEYCDEIKSFAEKYKDKIDIIAGFESEFYPEYFDMMVKNAVEYGAEYLILGQHFIKSENKGGLHSAKGSDRQEDLATYVYLVVDAIKTGVFTYVAHPDVFYFGGDKEIYRNEMRKICEASAEFNVPLELNFLGIREGRSYPTELFWEIAGEVGCPVTFGFDAHDVNSAYDDASYEKAMEIVNKYKLNYIGKPNIVKLKEFFA